MHSKQSFIVPLLAGAALATPVDILAPGISRRQDNIVRGCPTDACNTNTDIPEDFCNLFAGVNGYPECTINDTDFAFEDFPKDEAGNTIAYFKFPEPDAGCKYILKSPAGLTTEENCGVVKVAVTTSQCVKVALAETYNLQFCCGAGDCQKATGIGRRDPSGAILYDSISLEKSGKDGKAAPSLRGSPRNESSIEAVNVETKEDVAVIERLLAREGLSHLLDQVLAGTEVAKTGELSSSNANALQEEEESLAKRACTFQANGDPYTKLASNVFFAGGPVSCEGSETCEVSITESYSQSSTIEASVSVSDPFGIISASVGVSFTETTEHSMSSSFAFPPASVGYVSASPILQCWKGHFDGCDSDNGKEIEVCHLNPVAPTEVLSAVITG